MFSAVHNKTVFKWDFLILPECSMSWGLLLSARLLQTPPEPRCGTNVKYYFVLSSSQSSITQPLQDSPGQTMFLSMFLTLRHSVTSKHTIIVNIQTSDFLCNYTLNFFLDVSWNKNHLISSRIFLFRETCLLSGTEGGLTRTTTQSTDYWLPPLCLPSPLRSIHPPGPALLTASLHSADTPSSHATDIKKRIFFKLKLKCFFHCSVRPRKVEPFNFDGNEWWVYLRKINIRQRQTLYNKEISNNSSLYCHLVMTSHQTGLHFKGKLYS